MLQALVVAALAATLVGLAASLLLVREILRPLRQLAVSSRRIASGRYDERIAMPLSDELRDVAQSFNQMAAALERVEQQRVTLIGNVAHELRTPLAGLEGYLEGLLDGVLPDDPETIGAMQHEVRRLRRLVDDLQHLSRVEAGQVTIQPQVFDIVALVQRVVAQLRPQIIEQCLEIVVEAPDGAILAYATRIEPRRCWSIWWVTLSVIRRRTDASRSGCAATRRVFRLRWKIPASASQRKRCPTCSSVSTALIRRAAGQAAAAGSD